MKSPFETVTETFFENLDKLKENQRYNFNNSEKFMIWIVGFSIGGLSIISIRCSIGWVSHSVGGIALPFLLSSSALRYSSNFTSDGIK